MKFDINEARATIEAAKKRGLIREAGSDAPPAAASAKKEDQAKEVVLPDWLQNGLAAPAGDDKPSSPQWR